MRALCVVARVFDVSLVMCCLMCYAGEAQEWVRAMLTCCGRGGDGQKIRDEILNIMHRNHIPEKKGTWMEVRFMMGQCAMTLQTDLCMPAPEPRQVALHDPLPRSQLLLCGRKLFILYPCHLRHGPASVGMGFGQVCLRFICIKPCVLLPALCSSGCL